MKKHAWHRKNKERHNLFYYLTQMQAAPTSVIWNSLIIHDERRKMDYLFTCMLINSLLLLDTSNYLIALPRHTYSPWCNRQRNDPGCCDGEHTHRFAEPLSPELPPSWAWLATAGKTHLLCTMKASLLRKETPGWHIDSSLCFQPFPNSGCNTLYILCGLLGEV